VPFTAVEVNAAGAGHAQTLTFRTNLDDEVAADAQHPIRVAYDPDSREPRPYILVRDRLEARILRPVFYELSNSRRCSASATTRSTAYGAGSSSFRWGAAIGSVNRDYVLAGWRPRAAGPAPRRSRSQPRPAAGSSADAGGGAGAPGRNARTG